MGLEHADPPAINGAAYEWCCGDEYCWQHDNSIEDHAYDWLAYGIDDDELARLKTEWPECYADFVKMQEAYKNIQRRKK